MKKILILSASLLFIFASCSNKKDDDGGMSATAKKNIEAVRTVTKAFDSGDVSGIDAVIADDFVDHTPNGDMGRDSLKAMITMMHGKGLDMKTETLQELANDEYAICRYKFSGNGDGSMGMPKGPYEFMAVEVVKFNKDSKAVEHWEYMDAKDMMKMMAPPAKDNMSPTDTTSHM